jgi:hypothetical protein
LSEDLSRFTPDFDVTFEADLIILSILDLKSFCFLDCAMGAGASSFITSSCTYIQNLGLTASLPTIHFPQFCGDLFAFANSILSYILMLVPGIPAVDVRSQFVLAVFVIPLLLDLVVTWFILGIRKTAVHFLDAMALMGAPAIILHSYITRSMALWASIGFALVTAWMIARGIWKFCSKDRHDKPEETIFLSELAADIASYYLSDLKVPGVNGSIEICALHEKILRFSSVVAVNTARAGTLSIVGKIIFAVMLLVVSFICQGIIPIGIAIPSAVKILFPIVALPGAVLLPVDVVLDRCNVKLQVMQFLTHTGLRFFLLVLDFLYIPVLSLLVKCLTPIQTSLCPAEFYPVYIDNITNSAVAMFAERSWICLPCNLSEFDGIQCETLCGGNPEWRIQDDPHLLFVSDVLIASGGAIIFTILFVLIGLPFLWYRLVDKNCEFVYVINVFGRTAEAKWRSLTARLKTAGTFLFANYRVGCSKWSLVLISAKFVVMFVTTVSVQLPKLFLCSPLSTL